MRINLTLVADLAHKLTRIRRMYLANHPHATWDEMERLSNDAFPDQDHEDVMAADIVAMCVMHLAGEGIEIPALDETFAEAVMDIARAEMSGKLKGDLHATARRAWVLSMEYRKKRRSR